MYHQQSNANRQQQQRQRQRGRNRARVPAGELKMNERQRPLCCRAQSGFMYVGREVFDEIVASARSCNSIVDRARANV